ncbi:MAG: hypothetical protein U0570_10805 [Phycisphaerales bacterium]
MSKQALDQLRQQLGSLEDLLTVEGEEFFARQIGQALAGDDSILEAYLRSNELWGGSGSVADGALVHAKPSVRKKGAELLAALGEAQIAAGILNARTEMWASVFREWVNDDVFSHTLTDEEKAVLKHNIAETERLAIQLRAAGELETAATLFAELAKMKAAYENEATQDP